MITNTWPIEHIAVPDAPSIPGLTFRTFRAEADYQFIVDLGNAGSAADGVEDFVTLAWAKNYLSHLAGFDPRRDVLFAEIDSEPVALSRAWFRVLDDGTRVYLLTGSVLPPQRRRGLGRALLHWAEGRLREIAAEHPRDGVRVFRTFVADMEAGYVALLQNEGYQPIRYGYEMARLLSEDIPDLPLPAGLEVRPAIPKHYRAIGQALNEAFRDHWGHSEATEQDHQRWLNSPYFQPHLWQVAWDGDQVAGMVLAFIDAESNAVYHCQRGWTDPICVRRPWRKQGLARALIARSLRLLKEQGLTEAVLDVDAQNPNGALRLYEGMGYRVVKRFTTYEKPMD